MKTWLFIILATLFISGCKNKNKMPRDIIPQHKMQAVLWDMMRADLFLGDFVLSKDTPLSKRDESIKLYGQIFEIHKINKEQFEKSFSFYKSRPVLFKEIMDSISQPIIETHTEVIPEPVTLDSIIHTPQIKKDSIIPLRKRKFMPVN